MDVETVWPIVLLILDILTVHPDWSRDAVAYHLTVLLVSCPSHLASYLVNITCDLLNDDRASAESRTL